MTGRQWHRSQAFEARPDGSVLMRLDVCIDAPLRTFVLGFGGAVRVIAPLRLAQDVLEQLDLARSHYRPRLSFEILSVSQTESISAAPSMPMRRLWRAS